MITYCIEQVFKTGLSILQYKFIFIFDALILCWVTFWITSFENRFFTKSLFRSKFATPQLQESFPFYSSNVNRRCHKHDVVLV